MKGKKGSGIILLIVLAIIFFGPTVCMNMVQKQEEVAFGTSGIYQEEEVKALSAQVIALFESKEYGKIRTEYVDPDVQEQVLEADIQGFAEDVSDDWGAYVSTTSVTVKEMKQMGEYYAGVITVTKYENVDVRYILYFNDEMKLIGIGLVDNNDTETE